MNDTQEEELDDKLEEAAGKTGSELDSLFQGENEE